MDALGLFLQRNSLVLPDALAATLEGHFPEPLGGLVYQLCAPVDRPPALAWALAALRTAYQPAPKGFIPLAPVDRRSFACVVCGRREQPRPPDFGQVRRWHLDEVPAWAQSQLLDIDVEHYLATLAENLVARGHGLRRMQKIVQDYHKTHDAANPRPRYFEERPIRLAVQNVIVGLAAFRYEAAFDGLAVHVWQTCEAPHIAAHEGDRALAALMLGEAFRCGTTMEIRFDGHPESAVPATLRQFARTRGFELGRDDPQAVSPSESRRLIQAVTEMPESLAARLQRLMAEGRFSAERACFVLLSGIWDAVGLDYLAATSARVASILCGGAAPQQRPARQAELAVCRAAHMVGILHKVLSNPGDGTTAGRTRVLEDDRERVPWSILPELGAVRFENLRLAQVPWSTGRPSAGCPGEQLLVFPRCFPGERDIAAAIRAADGHQQPVALLVPRDTAGDLALLPGKVALMTFPDSLDVIDRAVEIRLLQSRVGRA